MLENKKEALKEVKTESEVVEKKAVKVVKAQYTVINKITLDKVYVASSTIEVDKGSDLEKYLVTNKFVNKHGISRPN